MRNPKHEFRNPKQIQNANAQNRAIVNRFEICVWLGSSEASPQKLRALGATVGRPEPH